MKDRFGGPRSIEPAVADQLRQPQQKEGERSASGSNHPKDSFRSKAAQRDTGDKEYITFAEAGPSGSNKNPTFSQRQKQAVQRPLPPAPSTSVGMESNQRLETPVSPSGHPLPTVDHSLLDAAWSTTTSMRPHLDAHSIEAKHDNLDLLQLSEEQLLDASALADTISSIKEGPEPLEMFFEDKTRQIVSTERVKALFAASKTSDAALTQAYATNPDMAEGLRALASGGPQIKNLARAAVIGERELSFLDDLAAKLVCGLEHCGGPIGVWSSETAETNPQEFWFRLRKHDSAVMANHWAAKQLVIKRLQTDEIEEQDTDQDETLANLFLVPPKLSLLSLNAEFADEMMSTFFSTQRGITGADLGALFGLLSRALMQAQSQVDPDFSKHEWAEQMIDTFSQAMARLVSGPAARCSEEAEKFSDRLFQLTDTSKRSASEAIRLWEIKRIGTLLNGYASSPQPDDLWTDPKFFTSIALIQGYSEGAPDKREVEKIFESACRKTGSSEQQRDRKEEFYQLLKAVAYREANRRIDFTEAADVFALALLHTPEKTPKARL